MSTYLDFESSRNGNNIPDSKMGFRDFLLSKKLKTPNGPQSFTKNSYQYSSLSEYPNIDLGNVDDNRVKDLTNISNSNTYKPINYLVVDNLNVLPRRANLNLYPYFVKGQNHSLVSILNTDNFDTESELFKFSANYIKNDKNGPIQSRLQQNLYKSTIGRVNFLDAANGNVDILSNIINGNQPLIGLDNRITIDKSETLENTNMFGLYTTKSKIPGDYLTNPLNQIEKPINETIVNGIDNIGTLFGLNKVSSIIKPSELLLQYMGEGQKKYLFDNLSYSKYNPNYIEYNGLLNSILSINGPYIGNDTTNDVRYTMSDYRDRIVRSNYYLSLMFDETQAKLFKIDRNIVNGGSISGNLTWISKKTKNKIGLYNEEFNSESSLYNSSRSTNYSFREDSILQVTQDLLNSIPTDSTYLSHVANAIDQTSRVFKDGDQVMSKGSAIKFVDKFNNEERGVEYCRVWTKDRSYMNYSDTMKRTGLVRNYNSSVLSTPWNLNIYPNSNGNGSFDTSTNIERHGNGFRAKKYMLSIENLVWKTSQKNNFTYEDLPYSERGVNGGRVMWFPPYGLKITEQNDAKWDENSFIGRPEPIFTYNSTTRSISLEFKIVVDHPSVLNLLTREHFKNMNDEEADNYINAFFAGCEDINFYDLIRRYYMLDSDDISNIQNYLSNGKPKDTNVLKDLKKEIGNPTITIPSVETSIKKRLLSYDLYFNNAIPAGDSLTTDESFSKLFETYSGNQETYIYTLLNGLNRLKNSNGWTETNKKDYEILSNIKTQTKPSENEFTKLISIKTTETNKCFFDANLDYNRYLTDLNYLKSLINENKIKTITVNIASSASSPDTPVKNKKLSYRRSYSVIRDIIERLTNNSSLLGTIMSEINWKVPVDENLTPNVEFNGDNVIKILLNKLGYNVDGEIIFKNITNNGENVIIKNIDCNKTNIPSDTDLDKTIPTVFWCRNSHVNIEYEVMETKDGNSIPVSTQPKPDNDNITKPKKPKIDTLKKIIMKILGEQYYFKTLESNSPLQFSSLKEKLKYFHPAFHSMTPEGLNSRLTFLHQCVRPGDTIPIKGVSDINDENARNTSFGPPPIIVLRIGDFYHTKAIIRSYNISYEDSQWDLNPEGIGVQPTLANVTLQLSLIGGQGMNNTVNEIQNALSSNFYANTEVYDYTSTETEDRTSFDKKTLSEIIEYQVSTNKQTSDDLTNANGVSLFKTIGNTNINDKTIEYNELIKELYDTVEKYSISHNETFNNVLNTYGTKLSSFILGGWYRKINKYNVITNTGNEEIILFGEYENCDITKYTDNLESSMLNVIENNKNNNGLLSLFKMDVDLTEKGVINNSLYKNLIKIIPENINNISYINLSIIENRNSLIKILDHLNFIVNTEHDGIIISDLENNISGRTLTDFNKTTFYNEYKNVIEYLKTGFGHYYEGINTTFEFGNITTLSDNDFLGFLPHILLDFDINTIVKDLTDKKISKKSIKGVTDKLVVSKSGGFKRTNKKLPVMNKNLSLKYSYEDGYNFTDEQKNILIKVNSTKKNNEQNSLNYYR